MRIRTYPSDLTDQQWRLVKHLIPVYPSGRPRTTCPRAVLNTIFYVLRTGCQWRLLPKDFPPKSTVWRYFNEWRHNGTLEAIHDRLREKVRKQEGRKRTPSAGSIDSQSVPATEGGEDRGYDANKKVNGRKRHVVVDTLGLLLAVAVTAASADDGVAATKPLGKVTAEAFPRLRLVWADQKYHNHELYGWVAANVRYEVGGPPNLVVGVRGQSSGEGGIQILPPILVDQTPSQPMMDKGFVPNNRMKERQPSSSEDGRHSLVA